MRRPIDILRLVLGVPVVLLVLGLGVGSTQAMPLSAVLYLDDDSRSYYAPPCVADSQGRALRLGSSREARALGYRPDPGCRDDGGFVQDGRSLSGKLLQRIGILPEKPSRWNPDGSWNW